VLETKEPSEGSDFKERSSTKYGALSTSGGRLAAAWRSASEAGNHKLHLIWTEAGGPPVMPPTRRGFGSKLIERSLIHEFDASVNAEFREAGLRCVIEIPLTAAFGRMKSSDSDAEKTP
jgi:two-component system CheB/CheR fusion protein